MLDLWQPSLGSTLGLTLLTAFALGLVHGITPDEHTWPITFSYAIGSYSTRRGLLAGLVFSAAFTMQRAIGSELAYLALGRWLRLAGLNAIVYAIVGTAMAAAGRHILQGRMPWRMELAQPVMPGEARRIPVSLAAAHGFIAGWGFGAFATILYTVLAPAMPSPLLGWLPGFLFGLGTLVVQALVGATFGWWSRRLGLSADLGQAVAGRVAGRTLVLGGIVFVFAGGLAALFPKLAEFAVHTPIRVHNLHSLGLGFALVLIVLLGIGISSVLLELSRATGHARRASDPIGRHQ